MKFLTKKLLIVTLVAAFGHLTGATNPLCDYKAAGVLPYAYNPEGSLKYLIGSSWVHKGEASDFGGLRDDEDLGNPQYTAAREGCEELLFAFDNNQSFEQIFKLRKRFGNSFDIAKAGSRSYEILRKKLKNAPFSTSNDYIMYFAEIEYDETLPERLKQRRAAYDGTLPRCWAETTQLAWVDHDELFRAINMHKRDITINGVTLFEPFVQSLIAAHSQGIVKRLLHCKRLSDIVHTTMVYN